MEGFAFYRVSNNFRTLKTQAKKDIRAPKDPLALQSVLTRSLALNTVSIVLKEFFIKEFYISKIICNALDRKTGHFCLKNFGTLLNDPDGMVTG